MFAESTADVRLMPSLPDRQDSPCLSSLDGPICADYERERDRLLANPTCWIAVP